jgi:TetR/AcrR family transcriptional regulator
VNIAVKRQNTAFRQKQIAVAAAELIVLYGSEHLTIKKLARHTELSEGAIYRHFGSKIDIFHFMLKHVQVRLLSELNCSYTRDTTSSSDLDSLIDQHISGIEESHGVEFQVIAEIISMGDVSLNQETFRIINSYIARLEMIFRKHVHSKYSGGKAESEILAFAFFTLLQGLVSLWALSGYAFDLKRKFYQVWTIYKKAFNQYLDPNELAKGRN